MCKFCGWVISILFLGLCFSGYNQNADASDGIKYISNRVKIVRPEKFESVSPGPLVEEAGSKMAPPTLVEAPSTTKAANAGIESQASGDDTPDVKTEAEIREEVSALIGKKELFYSRKGRIDPFEPFLRKPEPEVSVDEKAKLARRVPRTPLEKIDLSQLRLTAILRTPTKTKALVQEASGKGYVINQGTFIGNKGGQVSKILKDRIKVEEKYLDVFGKISVRERELKLQQ